MKIWSCKSDPECGHIYRVPLLEIMKVFTQSSEWNERWAIGKISRSYTSSHLMSVARYGLQELQNGLRRREEKVKEGSSYTERSNANCMKRTTFEH